MASYIYIIYNIALYNILNLTNTTIIVVLYVQFHNDPNNYHFVIMNTYKTLTHYLFRNSFGIKYLCIYYI